MKERLRECFLFINTAVCTDYSKKFGVFNVFASSQEFLREVAALKSAATHRKPENEQTRTRV